MEEKLSLFVRVMVLLVACAANIRCGSVNHRNNQDSNTEKLTNHKSNKLIIIFLENGGFDNAIAQPYLAKIAKQGALLTNYHSVAERSQPNYLALFAGSTFGVTNDSPVTLDRNNLVDLLEASGKSWKVYGEDYPGGCFLAVRSKQYHRKQNPAISFKNVQESSLRCEKIVSAEMFPSDLASNSLSDFTMYIPNQLNNGHDSDVAAASLWLEKFLNPILKNKKVMDETLVVVTFDEPFLQTRPKKIYAVLLGKRVVPGSISDKRYNHYNMLRTIQKYLDLGTLGQNDAKADEIMGVWQHDFE